MTNIYHFPGAGDTPSTQEAAEFEKGEAERRAMMLLVLDEVRALIADGKVRALILAMIDEDGCDSILPGIGYASTIEFRGLCDVLTEAVREAK